VRFVLIGAHVGAGGGLLSALERGDRIGAQVIQIFTQSPRAWKSSQHSELELAAYRVAQAAHPRIQASYCHASYLINLASSDPEVLRRSAQSLAANLAAARGMGASGLILHVGSHRGAGFETVVSQVADALLAALEQAPTLSGEAPCPILLENAAGAGGTVGRSFEELAAIIESAGAEPMLCVCLDTQHLWASGLSFASIEAADALLAQLDQALGVERLAALHLNDSKVAFGANRDRHENLGEGSIGAEGLAALLGHPSLSELPAILEVPGAGRGPRASDLVTARQLYEAGIELRRSPTLRTAP
jgi:deoxyribonuclease-4